MKSLLPIILIFLALVGGITYSLSKRSIANKPTNNIGIPANQLESDITPTPSENKRVTFGSLVGSPTVNSTITPTITPSITPTVTLPETNDKAVTPTPSVTPTTKITRNVVCTPVYGSANICTEHVVVDTGAENAAFFNFAGLAYIGGLASFVGAKMKKH